MKGRQKINEFIAQYEASLKDPDILKERKPEFNDWYWREYVRVWRKFGDSFDQGHIRLVSEYDRRELAHMMADLNNPYFALLDKMANEFKPLGEREGVPTWVRLVLSFQEVRSEAAIQSKTAKGGVLTKAAAEGKKVAEAGKVIIRGRARSPDAETLKTLDRIAKEAKQFNAYEKALSDIIPVTISTAIAYKMASEFYSGDGQPPSTGQPGGGQTGGGQSPFQAAHMALTKIKSSMRQQTRHENLFWRLLSGPLYFLLAYTAQEASCELQAKWEGSVLAEIQDMPRSKLGEALFKHDQGLVWQYVKGPAAPFLGRGRMGYYSRTSLDQRFPFKKSFLIFLDRGATWTQKVLPEYKVGLKTLPTNVNKGAFLEPFSSVLTLNCDAGVQTLENFNYPASFEFKWKPEKCGQVSLQIMFDDFTLTKTYEGVNGFPEFLADFKGGVKTFTRKDFPDREIDLSSINVNRITVSYLIDGDAPVRKLLDTKPLRVPQYIATCWVH